MKIYLGADHNGYDLKEKLEAYLIRGGYEVQDQGGTRQPQDDFPQFAARVCNGMLGDKDFENSRGILLCGSGQGMAMAANRFRGIRAVLAYDQESARSSRNDDNSNVLCLPARSLTYDQVLGIMHTWLITPFAEAPRFRRRIQEMDEF
ncbi:MAG: ribose 5-phosphate isomerase [Patescibacteria group bacterium]|nr:RpiB/LacA/LacB family sugar-phosphate isomerase [Candidatus Saccharibacteria bacterium]MDQ5963002.1 ribose 5-phosphate isomerase [Patescibacteria group bacterium]